MGGIARLSGCLLGVMSVGFGLDRVTTGMVGGVVVHGGLAVVVVLLLLVYSGLLAMTLGRVPVTGSVKALRGGDVGGRGLAMQVGGTGVRVGSFVVKDSVSMSVRLVSTVLGRLCRLLGRRNALDVHIDGHIVSSCGKLVIPCFVGVVSSLLAMSMGRVSVLRCLRVVTDSGVAGRSPIVSISSSVVRVGSLSMFVSCYRGTGMVVDVSIPITTATRVHTGGVGGFQLQNISRQGMCGWMQVLRHGDAVTQSWVGGMGNGSHHVGPGIMLRGGHDDVRVLNLTASLEVHQSQRKIEGRKTQRHTPNCWTGFMKTISPGRRGWAGTGTACAW